MSLMFPGRRHAPAVTREPGDLPVAVVPSCGRGVPARSRQSQFRLAPRVYGVTGVVRVNFHVTYRCGVPVWRKAPFSLLPEGALSK